MSPFAENVSREDVKNGVHFSSGSDTILIQISDPNAGFPTPQRKFKEIHQFVFVDADDSCDIYPEDQKITDEQAAQIVALLHRAWENNCNVLVHCHAGISRSGAVVEVACTVMGFTSTGNRRIPNTRIQHKMMKALGQPDS